MKILGYLLIGLACVLSTIWRGFVFCQLWTWFLVPVLKAPPINLAWAVGVMALITFITFQFSPADSAARKAVGFNNTENLVEAAVVSFILPMVALAIGWVAAFWL